ncbi:glycosyltransferase [bacterium]|nr:glycosyltransferase [bacterium]
MLRFKPSRSVQSHLNYFGKTIADVQKEELEGIRARLRQLQSEAPVVSVCMIAWNEERNIVAALSSLSQQRSRYPMEIIVVDNNSADRTAETIRALGARYVSESNQGYAWARQRGVVEARGRFILSADADTVYPELWVETMVKALDKPQIACTYALHAFFTQDGRYPLGLMVYQWLKYVGIWIKDFKRPHLNCGGAGMGFPKDLAVQVGGYDVNVVRGSDGTLAFELGKLGAVRMVRSVHGQIWTSMRRTELDGSLWNAFWKRFALQMRYFLHYFSPQKER